MNNISSQYETTFLRCQNLSLKFLTFKSRPSPCNVSTPHDLLGFFDTICNDPEKVIAIITSQVTIEVSSKKKKMKLQLKFPIITYKV